MTYHKSIPKQLGRDTPFLWFLYDNAKGDARYRLNDLAERYQKMSGYLDALSLAMGANKPVEQWVNTKDWGTGFVLAALGKHHHRPELFQALLNRLDENDQPPWEVADTCLWDPAEIQALTPWPERLLSHSKSITKTHIFNGYRKFYNGLGFHGKTADTPDHRKPKLSVILSFFNEQPVVLYPASPLFRPKNDEAII
jgi:hypothetical protein